ncbi:hypothetical protein PQO03_04695 [Lentisphaera profundi]|uniref:Uncharacterized protein n=1 Tax=Lentisphaera profundi TaxID=1658616 RepID=A0ABY7VU10_9BACT|nr:hypothetical protein [Lentisphaera profundi]WDE97249.1 hypothetical protein PQO03_04695 [Lentisphaera profundi]
MKKIITSLMLIIVMFAPVDTQAQGNSNVERKSKITVNPDGSKTIIIYSVNERGEEIKTVTIIKVTEFLDGSKFISKSVKIFTLVKTGEILSKSFIENSIIRPRVSRYRQLKKTDGIYVKTDNGLINITDGGGGPASPDGR